MKWSIKSRHLTVIVVLVIPILSVTYLMMRSRFATMRSLISSPSRSYCSAVEGSLAQSSMRVIPATKSRSAL